VARMRIPSAQAGTRLRANAPTAGSDLSDNKTPEATSANTIAPPVPAAAAIA
jgi:hypothetical protein